MAGRECHCAPIRHGPGVGSGNPSIGVNLLSQHLQSFLVEKIMEDNNLLVANKYLSRFTLYIMDQPETKIHREKQMNKLCTQTLSRIEYLKPYDGSMDFIQLTDGWVIVSKVLYSCNFSSISASFPVSYPKDGLVLKA